MVLSTLNKQPDRGAASHRTQAPPADCDLVSDGLAEGVRRKTGQGGVIQSAERGCGVHRASYHEARGRACTAPTLRREERALAASGCTARCDRVRSTAWTAAGRSRGAGSQPGAAALRLGFCQRRRALDWRDARPAHRIAFRQAGVPRAGLGWRCARHTRCRRWVARHAPSPRRRPRAIPVRYATPRFDCIKPGALGSMRIPHAVAEDPLQACTQPCA